MNWYRLSSARLCSLVIQEMAKKESVVLLLLFTSLSLIKDVAGDLTTISVNANGHDVPSCITNQQEACRTLSYALNQLPLYQPSIDVLIKVIYSHAISPVNVTFHSDLNLTIQGISSVTLQCINEGFVLMSAFSYVHPVNLSVTMDGLSWKDCTGYYMEDDEVVGLYFANLNTFSFTHNFVSNCTDLVIIRTQNVYISNSTFNKNYFYNGQVYLAQQVGTDGSEPPNSTTYLIEGCTFINNIGLSTSIATPTATIGIYIQSHNDEYNLLSSIKSCNFSNNVIAQGQGLNSSFRSVAEVGIMLAFGKANLVNLEFKDNFFSDDYGNYGRNIWIDAYSPLLHILKIEITGNTFFNNSVSIGQLVSFYFSDMTITSIDISLTYNAIVYNTGNGFHIEHWNVSEPGTFLISNNNFTANNGSVIVMKCRPCLYPRVPFVTFDNVLVAGNVIPLTVGGVLQFTNQQLFLLNSTFYANVGTALYIVDCNVYVSGGVLLFLSNSGRNGGGVALHGQTVINVYKQSQVQFYENCALYGGAIYIDVDFLDYCYINDPYCNMTTAIRDNRASSSGNNLYLTNPNVAFDCLSTYLDNCYNISDYLDKKLGFGSSGSEIGFMYGDNDTTSILTIFPGQNIVVNTSVYGAFDERSSCVASVYLQCENQVISCGYGDEFLQLEGPTKITLSKGVFTSDLRLLAPNKADNFTTFSQPSLHFECRYSNQAILYLNIKKCPLGFTYNSSSSMCQCAWEDHHNYACSLKEGKSCIAKGYWYGRLTIGGKDFYILVKCQYLYCSRDAQDCPASVGKQQSSSYVLLASFENGQCTNDRGGIMCMDCRDGASFSFEGIHCISGELCKPWQPYLLLILVISFQLLLSFMIKFAISIKFSSGLGFLYGPLFFLAVINHLPFGYYAEYYKLKIIVSIFTSVFLLNMEIFGQIPWCFFSSLSALENYAFHYLGPIIVSSVLLMTVFTARRCPRLQETLNVSPLRAICLLMLLSFWSLADTSIQILRFSHFPDVDTLRVTLQPNLTFFTGTHIPFAIFALLILLVLIIPFVILLVIAPFLAKKVNLVRLKPLLDQFQASYEDNYRWYPALYMIFWMLILPVQNITVVTQILLAAMASIHFLFRPYRNKWLNVVNTLLLSDLILLTALIEEQSNPVYSYTQNKWIKPFYAVVIYTLTLLPLLYIIFSGVYIIIRHFKCHKILLKKVLSKEMTVLEEPEYTKSLGNNTIQRTSTTSREVSRQIVEISENAYEYREPLLALLPENEQQASTLDYGTHSSLEEN